MERNERTMNDVKPIYKSLNILLLLLTLLVTICGVCSFNTVHACNAINQYGETIKMWGAGIYAHDSYFKAPIFIGSDFTILVFVIPVTFCKGLFNQIHRKFTFCKSEDNKIWLKRLYINTLGKF